MTEEAIATTRQFDVDVDRVQARCTPDGGNGNVNRGDTIRWKTPPGLGTMFSLSFRRDPASTNPDGPDWPFGTDPAPASGSATGWTNNFVGRLVDTDAKFKYCVHMDDGSDCLDPMIIVGRG